MSEVTRDIRARVVPHRVEGGGRDDGRKRKVERKREKKRKNSFYLPWDPVIRLIARNKNSPGINLR